MKTPSLSAGSSFLELYASFGVSQEAEAVASMLSEFDGETLQSVSLGEDKSDALKSLYKAFCEACQLGWDGHNAPSASYESYVKAEKFIQAFPANIPAPEVALDPDGEVSLEWYRAPSSFLSKHRLQRRVDLRRYLRRVEDSRD